MAGWASVFAAVITIPQVLFSLLMEVLWERTSFMTFIEIVVMFAGLILYIFIFLKLKKLLIQHADFSDANIYISLIIWINVIVVAISAISLFQPSIEGAISILILVSLFLLGIIYVVFGIILLKCKIDFSGRLKYFSYFNIATGIFLATIILFFLGIITSIIADIILAIIFFTESSNEQSNKEIIAEKSIS
jgi:hypothetical protein